MPRIKVFMLVIDHQVAANQKEQTAVAVSQIRELFAIAKLQIEATDQKVFESVECHRLRSL